MRQSKVNPLRSSHLSSGAAESLLFVAHPEGLSANGIHMISISSGRREAAIRCIGFFFFAAEDIKQTVSNCREKRKSEHTVNNVRHNRLVWRQWNGNPQMSKKKKRRKKTRRAPPCKWWCHLEGPLTWPWGDCHKMWLLKSKVREKKKLSKKFFWSMRTCAPGKHWYFVNIFFGPSI